MFTIPTRAFVYDSLILLAQAIAGALISGVHFIPVLTIFIAITCLALVTAMVITVMSDPVEGIPTRLSYVAVPALLINAVAYIGLLKLIGFSATDILLTFGSGIVVTIILGIYEYYAHTKPILAKLDASFYPMKQP